MSMKRKVTIGMIALLTNMILYTGCSNSNVSLSNSSPTLPEVNETSIAAAIEQSAMEDGGYRFANAEFESQFSVYATYYIRMAKEYAGWSQSPISPETKSEIEEKFLNASDMDLTDIFCAISLLGSNENLPAKTKENISSYLDSLYDKDLKCYTLFYNGEGNEYIFNIYANYLVDFISSSLNMKKMLKSALALAMGAVMLMPVTAFAAEDEPTLISTQEVALSPSGANTRSAETKEFTLSTYEDNGRTVYSFDVEDEEYRQAAMEYINELTGDPGPTPQTRGILQPGESEYHNDTQYDGDAMSYAWKRNTAGQTDNNFEGGQSSLWSGSGNCDYIVLNQGISVSGIAVSISWPPSVSGSGSSASWQSQPVYDNVAGASFNGLVVGGTAFSCTFSENGDVYVGSRIYRPTTTIKFSYFS